MRFNDRFGTGQSVLDGILRATNLLLAGQTVVVLGYGWTGRGVALRAHGLGASVIVCEVDPLRALEARMEGFAVMPALAAAERGDVFITVTGGQDVLRGEHFARMKDGAVLANAGHFDVEISLPDLRAAAVEVREVLPLVERTSSATGALNLLAGGRVVNLAAAEGHPGGGHGRVVRAAGARRRGARAAGRARPACTRSRTRSSARSPRLKLAALDVEIDTLTPEQAAYRSLTSPPRDR